MNAPTATGAALYDLLVAVEARFRALTTHLPEDAPAVGRWSGILFRVGASRLLTRLDQVVEVLSVPADLTPVPGTKPWVLGVANNRGTLLPLLDLAALTQDGVPTRRETDRVLVVRQDDLPCGLVANEVLGIRHFAEAQRCAAPSAGIGVLQPFAQGAFPLAGAVIPVIALDLLLADPLVSQDTSTGPGVGTRWRRQAS
ncbi:chemotaxis protein CheW [uncultured Lamprocystis sp.]|jgi:twitching motility protein PilI|uniref:chemotaxis protein CheW n=1 Tax=uncultured Lamprocystis sp. TaxID=543132 RepID=UPI0025D9DC3D|nr:chemotaxis protein CheW [uncultured Lamprocystis sp.]